MSAVTGDKVLGLLEVLTKDQRDNSAWCRLFNEIWPTVVAATARFGVRAEVKDVQGEVIARLFKKNRFPHFCSAARFRGYVWATVRSIANAERTGRTWQISENRRELVRQCAVPALDRGLVREMLLAVLKELKPREVEFLELLTRRNITYREMANILGTTHQAVVVKTCRLKERIRQILRRRSESRNIPFD